MAEKKNIKPEEIEKKIIDLKIELLKQPMKKKNIKKEIARLLTLKTSTKLAPKGVPSEEGRGN